MHQVGWACLFFYQQNALNMLLMQQKQIPRNPCTELNIYTNFSLLLLVSSWRLLVHMVLHMWCTRCALRIAPICMWVWTNNYIFKYVLSTMGVSKESISKFLIGNRFHIKLCILSP